MDRHNPQGQELGKVGVDPPRFQETLGRHITITTLGPSVWPGVMEKLGCS